MGLRRSRLVGAAAGLAALLAPAGTARAAGTVTMATSGALVEDVAGGIATTFHVDAPGAYDLDWHVHDDAQIPCATTAAADGGRRIRSRSLESLRAPGDTWTIYTTFADPGRYRVCAWATPSGGDGEAVAGQAVVTVGEPKERLSLLAPATVAAGRTFGLRAIATSQAWRMAFVTVNAADIPCASSYLTDQAVAPVVVGLVRNTFSRTTTARLARPGIYRVCGWLQEHSRDPEPELRVERLIRVVGRRGAARPAHDFDSR